MVKIVMGLLIATLLMTTGVVIANEGAKEPAVVGNSMCPVSCKPVAGDPKAPSFYSDFKGYRIGFMCPVCKGKFDSKEEEGKLEFLNKALTSVGKEPVK